MKAVWKVEWRLPSRPKGPMDSLAATWFTLPATGPAPAAGDEAALVAAARRGDQDAFTALVRAHQARVFRLAGRFFRQRADVEDAAQDTFLRAWHRLTRYDGRAPFEHWLTRVCLNCCYDRLRRARPEAELPADPPGPAHSPDVRLDLQRLLGALRPADRFLLLLLEGEGWSVEEVAERLGWTKVNVRVRAHRARARLRRWLEETAA
jgi:RNA polymerase sigma-70 factor (ECF subfamily)